MYKQIRYLFLAAGLCSMVSAQTLWLDNGHEQRFTLEFNRPSLEESDFADISVYTMFFNMHLPLGNTTDLVGTVPVAYSSISYSDFFGNEYDESETALGNIYAGLEIHRKDAPTMWEIGLYLPTASSENSAVSDGLIVEWVDRPGAFAPDYLIANALINVLQTESSGLDWRFRAGPSFWFSTGDRSDGTEIFMQYGGKIGFKTRQAGFFIGLNGRWWQTQDNLDGFSEQTFHQMALSAHIGNRPVQAGVIIRLPLDEDFSDAYNYILGLSLSLIMP